MVTLIQDVDVYNVVFQGSTYIVLDLFGELTIFKDSIERSFDPDTYNQFIDLITNRNN